MFYLIIIALGVIIGLGIKHFSSSDSNFINRLEIKEIWLLYSILAIQLGYRILSTIIDISNQNIILITIQAITAMLAISFILYNIKQLSVVVIGIGFLFNLLVMGFNNGKMPVLVSEGYMDIKHSIIDNTTKLKGLSDIVSLPYPLNVGMPRASIGDIIVGLGIMLVVIQLTGVKKW